MNGIDVMQCGCLRDPDGSIELYALLDHLIDLGLLRPLCTRCGQRADHTVDRGVCGRCAFAAGSVAR